MKNRLDLVSFVINKVRFKILVFQKSYKYKNYNANH